MKPITQDELARVVAYLHFWALIKLIGKLAYAMRDFNEEWELEDYYLNEDLWIEDWKLVDPIVEIPDKLENAIRDMISALTCGMPANGICSHHGIMESVQVGRIKLNISMWPRHKQLAIAIERPDWFDHKQIGLTADAFKYITEGLERVAPIVDSWNGKAGGVTGSFVLDYEPPKSLADGVQRYHDLENVFKMSDEDSQLYKDWHTSYAANYKNIIERNPLTADTA